VELTKQAESLNQEGWFVEDSVLQMESGLKEASESLEVVGLTRAELLTELSQSKPGFAKC
jgi:hypothetical protein